MYTKHSIKTLIIVGFIFLTLIGVLFTSIVGSVEIDEGDGVWSDDFKTAGSVDCNNCTVDNDDGIIMLNKSTDERQYNFSEENFPHTAYAYKSLFFLPITKLFSPESHTEVSIFDIYLFNFLIAYIVITIIMYRYSLHLTAYLYHYSDRTL